MKINKITWGLPRKWWYKPKVLVKRIIFVIKHGYAPQARWEHFAWFIDTMREILTWYRDNRCSSPVGYDTYHDEIISGNECHDQWTSTIQEMLRLLDAMDEENPMYENINFKQLTEETNKAKDKFFDLYKEHFFDFWD